jgi:hypothetical protein
MSLHFFSIPALQPQMAQDEFNAFCAAHRVLQVERQFVAAGAQSFWALCATVASGPGPLPAALKRPPRGVEGEAGNERKLDYKELLSEPDFVVFAALRQLRKTLAEQDGVPLYAVFSNEQLATLARERCASLEALGRIDGVGPLACSDMALPCWPAWPRPAWRNPRHEAPGAHAGGDCRSAQSAVGGGQGRARQTTQARSGRMAGRAGAQPGAAFGRHPAPARAQWPAAPLHHPRSQNPRHCFADRVLHHAMLNLAEPRFEQALVLSSFACRPGMGVHAAVAAVQR